MKNEFQFNFLLKIKKRVTPSKNFYQNEVFYDVLWISENIEFGLDDREF